MIVTNPVQSIIIKLGGPTKMAAALGGIPMTTVRSWGVVNFIPTYRRDRVKDAVERLGIKLNRSERKALEL